MLPMLCIFYMIFLSSEKLFSKKNFLVGSVWLLALLLWYYLRSFAPLGNTSDIVSITNFWNNLLTIPEFVGKFFTTVNVSVLPAFKSLTTILGISSFLIINLLLFINKESRKKVFLFGLLWFLFFTVPGMFSLVFSDRDFFDYFECRAYLPSFGLLLMLLEVLPKRQEYFYKKGFLISFAVVLIFLSSYTIVKSYQYSTPLKFWRSAVKDSPERARYHFELGINYKMKKEYRKAEQRLFKAIKLNPKRPEFYYELGQLYFVQKNYEKAVANFLEALDIFPTWHVPKNELSRSFFILKRYNEAAYVMKDLLSTNPNSVPILKNIINIYLEANQFDSVVVYSQKLEQVSTEVIPLGFLLNRSGVDAAQLLKFDIAEIRWKQAIEFQPDYKDPYYNLFNLYLKTLNDYKKAKQIADMMKNRGFMVDEADLELLRKQNN